MQNPVAQFSEAPWRSISMADHPARHCGLLEHAHSHYQQFVLIPTILLQSHYCKYFSAERRNPHLGTSMDQPVSYQM